MASEGGADQTDWPELAGKVLAAGAGAAIGLPVGVPGAMVGAAAAPALEPVAVEIMRWVGQAGKRRSGELLAAACETAGLSSAEELLELISENEKLQLLTGVAIAAATRTVWEDKVQTLGKSLATGLLATDEAKVDTEQLIMAAIADMEPPHLALLDLLVAWRPPWVGGEANPIRLDIREDSHSQPVDRQWSVCQRKWYVHVIQTYRPRLIPVFSGLVGTLQRHGLATYESNVDNSFSLRLESYDPEMQRPYVEPTELSERVWLRFYKAGANVPDVWVAPPPSPEG